MMVTVSVPRTYMLARHVLEETALQLKERNPYLHLATACQRALERQPTIWRFYQAGIRYGMTSEFLRPKRRPSRPTPRDRAYYAIEDLARTLIGLSDRPMTLRTAVLRVAEARPDLLERYREAIRRGRRKARP